MYGTRGTNTFESPGITGRSVDVCVDRYFLHLYLSDYLFLCWYFAYLELCLTDDHEYVNVPVIIVTIPALFCPINQKV